jgi:peptide/nickel transport system substrate-binding protein
VLQRFSGLVLATSLVGCAAPASREEAPREPLVVLLSDKILGLDPNLEVESVTESVLFNVYEPLVGFDDKLGIRTMLAESWEHPRPEQWRFRLRPGVRFHDGTPLTAPLVRDALLAVRSATGTEPAEFLTQVVDIAAVDDRTLDLITAQPRALLASLPVIYVVKKNAGGSFPALVGTGPYRVGAYDAGTGQVELVRTNDYWGQRPEFERVRFLAVRDPAERVRRLERGDADISYDLSPRLASSLTWARLVRRPGVTLYYLGLDLRPGRGNPLSKQPVRQALHRALDRRRIVQDGQNGMAVIAHQTAPSSVFGFDPTLVAPSPDPAAAWALLEQAGYPKGFSLTIDAAREVLPAARLVAADFQGIGLRTEVREGARHEVWDRAQHGESQAFLVGWSFTSGESGEFFEYCLHTPTGSYGFFNYGRYKNPKIDAIAERNAAILDAPERRRQLQGAAALVMQDLPVLPLYVADDVYGVRPGVSFRPRPDGEIWLPDVRTER